MFNNNINSKIIVGIFLLTISSYYLKKYFSGCVCENESLIHAKTVIITGANSGIGFETAKELARRGARILLACRNVTLCEQAKLDILKSIPTQADLKDRLVCKLLNLGSKLSIEKFAKSILTSEKQIDLLINNAGVMAINQFTQTSDGVETQFGVNYLGHFLLTKLLIGRIMESAPSRIVILSSLMHKFGSLNFSQINEKEFYSPMTAYSNSKLANVLHAKELAKRYGAMGLIAVSVHPGSVTTELGKHWINKWLNIIIQILGRPFLKTPYEGAQTTLFCALEESVSEHNGEYYSECLPQIPLNEEAKDDDLSRRLWVYSEELLNSLSHHQYMENIKSERSTFKK